MNNYASSINNYYFVDEEENPWSFGHRKGLKAKPNNLLFYIFFLQCLQSDSIDLTEEELTQVKNRALFLSMVLSKEKYFIYVLTECNRVKNGQTTAGITVDIVQKPSSKDEGQEQATSNEPAKPNSPPTARKPRSRSKKDEGGK